MNKANELLHALLQPGVLPGAEDGVELIETHISWILLAGTGAWKLKKPLDLGFLDFSTVERRREACLTELRINRRTLPEVYEAVVPIYGPAHAPRLGDALDDSGDHASSTEQPIDFLVRMRRFDQDALFSSLRAQNRLDGSLFDQLAAHVAAFHHRAEAAPAATNFGSPEAVHAPVRQNFLQVRAHLEDGALRDQLATVEAWAEAQFTALSAHFARRRTSGRVRECHGDLHLGNLLAFNGEPRLFDALEFDPALRWIDVIADIAFLVMDLHAWGRKDLATRFLNAWLEHSGDYEGIRLLPYYFSYRAMVRAKVAAIRARQVDTEDRQQAVDECRRYLDLAGAPAQARAPALLIANGLSGTGKTSQSQPLLEQLGLIRLRADVERKRLFGLAANARSASGLHADLYGAAATVRTYDRLAELARVMLQAGYPVLVDATFLRQAQRRQFARLADELGLPFVILAFEAPLELLRERVRLRAARGDDASEADETVLEAQLISQETLTAEERLHSITIDTRLTPDWQQFLPALQTLWPATADQ